MPALVHQHPAVLVSSISFSAFSDLGQLAGHQIGVDVVGLPSSPTPIGAMTGMKSPRTSRSRRGVDARHLADVADVDDLGGRHLRRLVRVTVSLRARMSSPSLPVRPTALPPCRLMRLTMSLLT